MEHMLIKIHVYVLSALLSVQIASQLTTVLHAKMDTYFIDTMYVGKHFSLANFFALLAHVHQHIVYLAFQDIYFIKTSA